MILFAKISVRRSFWIYTVCTLITIALLFGLNWVLKQPKIVDVIGDENTWLPIVANSVVSGIIFIAGNWYSNADRLRSAINDKKNDFSLISDSVNRIINSLNISRKQLSILYSIEISMETPALIQKVLAIQQEIDESQQEFNRIKYLITDTSNVASFEECFSVITESYHIVFDTMQRILNDWISTVSLGNQAKTVADYIGKSTDKTNYALKYVESCNSLLNEKEKLLSVYEKQKENVSIMFSDVQTKGKKLLDAEYANIVKLENKL